MNKKIFIFIFILSAALPQLVLSAIPAQLQQQINQTRRERDALLEEQRKLQAELDRVSREGQTLGTAVKSLDATRKKLANDLKITQSKIASANLNIQALETSMTDKERQIATHKRSIATALQALSEYDSRSLVADILSYEKISEVWRDRGTLDDLNVKLGEEIEELKEAKILLSKEKELKEKNKEELVDLSGQLNGQKKVVEETQSAKARLLAETKQKEAEYQRLIQDNIARQRQTESDLFRLESELKITLDPSLIPQARHSILSWPLDKVYVTQRFGRTVGASRLYASGSHNGIDFRASVGTPVKAALGGVVEGIGNTDDQRGCYSYGRWILIKHGNGLSTIYAHLSGSVVRAGQTVTTGQVIGYSGGMPGQNGSGFSTGPHLHLGVFASQGVAIRQFTSSNNCKLVYVPIADVQAYLDPMVYLPTY